MLPKDYRSLLSEINELQPNAAESDFEFGILSNVVIHPFEDILRHFFLSKNINPSVRSGNFDNIVQDAASFSRAKIVFIFWELMGVLENVDEYQKGIDESSLIETIKTEISLFFDQIGPDCFVIFNYFSAISLSPRAILSTKEEMIEKELNIYLSTIQNRNLFLVNIDKIISLLGIDAAIDYRMFRIAKAPYKYIFLSNYLSRVAPIVNTVLGNKKKVLVADCDNTLWKGVIGEDGVNGVSIFSGVQRKIVSLVENGVLLCLSSKNNPEDVEEVLEKNKDMVLTNEHILLKKVSWQDKASSLRELSEELNLGLDSFVFIDDSDFEINLVKSQLPQVDCFQVPKSDYAYEQMIDEIANMFVNLSSTKEDKERTSLYKMDLESKKAIDSFENIEDFLRSLDLQLKIFINEGSHIERVAQLTQKTNQFNLTTRRYTESIIEKFVGDKNSLVITGEVSDKFGHRGLTAVAIVILKGNSAYVDTLLLSCRILGRRIEDRFILEILKILGERDVTFIESEYVHTKKNQQVVLFWDKFGFVSKNKGDFNDKSYGLNLTELKQVQETNFIGVKYG